MFSETSVNSYETEWCHGPHDLATGVSPCMYFIRNFVTNRRIFSETWCEYHVTIGLSTFYFGTSSSIMSELRNVELGATHNPKPWEGELSGLPHQYIQSALSSLVCVKVRMHTAILVLAQRVSRAVLHLTESVSKNSEVSDIRAPPHCLQGNTRVSLKYATTCISYIICVLIQGIGRTSRGKRRLPPDGLVPR
jgi:hypothetical protein